MHLFLNFRIILFFYIVEIYGYSLSLRYKCIMSYTWVHLSALFEMLHHKNLYDLIMIANRRAQRERSKAEGGGVAE